MRCGRPLLSRPRGAFQGAFGSWAAGLRLLRRAPRIPRCSSRGRAGVLVGLHGCDVLVLVGLDGCEVLVLWDPFACVCALPPLSLVSRMCAGARCVSGGCSGPVRAWVLSAVEI